MHHTKAVWSVKPSIQFHMFLFAFSCHSYDKLKLYDTHLKQKDSIYKIIMRSVKMITNFARTGWESWWFFWTWILIFFCMSMVFPFDFFFVAIKRDPTIEGDTPFKSCQSSDEIFCQEVSNERTTRVTYDIKEQMHYDLWKTIEKEATSLKPKSTGNKASCFDQGTTSIIVVCVFTAYVHLLL